VLKDFLGWKVSEKESCSDHKIIQFGIGNYNVQQTGINYQSIKYTTREENIKRFDELVTQEIGNKVCWPRWEEYNKDLVKYIFFQIANTENKDAIVHIASCV